MLLNKTIVLLLLIFLSAFSIRVQKTHATKWVVLKGGSLKVAGSTNINNFNCEITNYSKPDTIKVIRNTTAEALQINGVIKLDVQNFDCHNPVMTGDLKKTLKVKEFPALTINFLNLNKYPDFNAPLEKIKGDVVIGLAGVTKRFKVNYKFVAISENEINLVGTQEVNFSDFKIIPPRKVGGMIQTKNELKVVFNLRLKVIED